MYSTGLSIGFHAAKIPAYHLQIPLFLFLVEFIGTFVRMYSFGYFSLYCYYDLGIGLLNYVEHL